MGHGPKSRRLNNRTITSQKYNKNDLLFRVKFTIHEESTSIISKTDTFVK